MPALTQERPTLGGDLTGFTHFHEPIALQDATIAYKGALIALHISGATAGEVAPGVTATTMQGLGRAVKTVDNTDDGEVLEVEAGAFWWDNSAAADEVTAENIGSLCYIVDDQTVAATDGTSTRSPAGRVVDVHATHGVLVLSHPAVF